MMIEIAVELPPIQKIILMKLRPIYLSALWLAVVSFGAMPPQARSQDQQLTTEETLGAVFLGEPAWNVYRLANKEAKNDLYKLLNHKEAEEYHPAIFRMLGFIGDASDANRLREIVSTKYSGELTVNQTLSIQAIFESLGLMSKRGIEEASKNLDKMLAPDSWKTSEIRWPSVTRAGRLNNNYETEAWVVLGYALSEKSDLTEKTISILDTITDPETKKYMEHRISPTRMLEYAQMVATAQMKPIAPELRQALVQLFNKDFEHPRRMKLTTNQVEPQKNARRAEPKSSEVLTASVSVSIRQEALAAFAAISESLLKNEFQELAKHLADNGRPMLPTEKQNEASIAATAEKLKAMTRDMEATKNLLKDVKAQGSNYGEAQGEALPDGTLVIKIPCLGSKEVKSHHLPRHHETRTTDSEDRLVIYMIKQGEQWYWNPFGW